MAKIQFYGQLQEGRGDRPVVDVQRTSQGRPYARIFLREVGKKDDGSNWFGPYWHTTIWDETLVNLSVNFQPGDVLQVSGDLRVKWDKDRQKEFRDVNLNSGSRIEKKSHIDLVRKASASSHTDGFMGVDDPWGGTSDEPSF